MTTIYYWSNGTWCEASDLNHYLTFNSDDYGQFSIINGDIDDTDNIDDLVQVSIVFGPTPVSSYTQAELEFCGLV